MGNIVPMIARHMLIYFLSERFIKVANETMCRPIRALTEAKGYATAKHTFVFPTRGFKCFSDSLFLYQPRKLWWCWRSACL